MTKTLRRKCLWLAAVSPLTIGIVALGQSRSSQIGREVAVPVHLQDGDEFTIPREQLIEFGAQLFNAKFTIQEGAGRPHSKGTGARGDARDRKSTRLNSSHGYISYAVFCLKKKTTYNADHSA